MAAGYELEAIERTLARVSDILGDSRLLQAAALPEDDPAALTEALSMLTQLAGVGTSLPVDGQGAGSASSAAAAGDTIKASVGESRLLRAEARYRTLIEQIPAVTFLASLSGDDNEIYVSPQIEALLGFTQEEWGSNPILWYEQIHPDDRDQLATDFAAACLTGGPFRGVIRVHTRAGELRWVHAEARLVRDEQGNLLFLQGVGFDVTDQIRAQETRQQLAREQAARAEADRDRQRLHELFTRLPAAIAVLRGPDHVIEFLNPVASALAGAGNEAIGRTWAGVFPEFGREITSALQAVFTSGRSYTASEYPVRSLKWEGLRFFNLVCHPLDRSQDDVRRILLHAADVTEQVRARHSVEEQMATVVELNTALRATASARDEALRDLRQAMHTRDEFLSAAAHDLRTPLTIIKGSVQLLKRRAGRPGALDAQRLSDGIDSIEVSVNRMTGMIDQLLDLTRLALDRPIDLKRQPTDLVALAQRLVEEHQKTTELHQLRFRGPAATLIGNWDAARLERVLGNLLNNAIKYSPDGGEIELSVCREFTQDGESAVVRVCDHGLGIPAADLPRLFERFHRAANVVGRISGTGIGLTGARQIVASHGGTIAVQSEEGIGSTFAVRLPLNREGGDASDPGR